MTNSPATLTYTVTPKTTNDCFGDTFNVSVTVDPLGQVTNPGDQEFCNNDNIVIDFSTVNTGGDTTFSWTNSNSAIGLSNSGTGNINVTATNTGNDPIISTVTVTPSFEGCEGTPQTFTITVNPALTMNDPQDMVVCNAELTSIVEFTTTNTGIFTTYSWTNDTPQIGLAAAGSGDLPSFTAINNGTEAIVANIQVTPQFTENSDCDAVSQSFTITVNPKPNISDSLHVICSGEALDGASFDDCFPC